MVIRAEAHRPATLLRQAWRVTYLTRTPSAKTSRCKSRRARCADEKLAPRAYSHAATQRNSPRKKFTALARSCEAGSDVAKAAVRNPRPLQGRPRMRYH